MPLSCAYIKSKDCWAMRKNLKNNAENVWRLCFIALLLHPHSRENGDTEIMKQIFLEKSSEIIWKFKRKTLIFASTFAKRKRQKSSLRDLHNSTSSTSIRKINFPDWYRQRSMTLDYNNGFRSEDIKNNLNNEEFDPGSGWTLATGLTHASRGAAQVAIPGGDRRTGE